MRKVPMADVVSVAGSGGAIEVGVTGTTVRWNAFSAELGESARVFIVSQMEARKAFGRSLLRE